MAAKWFNSLDTNSNSPTISNHFLDFSCQKGTLIWNNILSNLWMLTRLINLVKTQIQILLFEFIRQNANSNQLSGFFLPNFFLSKHRCKWIYLILPSKHKIKINFLDFMSESKLDLKKIWKVTCCQNRNQKKIIEIFWYHWLNHTINQFCVLTGKIK